MKADAEIQAQDHLDGRAQMNDRQRHDDMLAEVTSMLDKRCTVAEMLDGAMSEVDTTLMNADEKHLFLRACVAVGSAKRHLASVHKSMTKDD